MSEEFDDYDYEDDYDDKKPKEEKEVIEGYTVQTSVNVGHKRIIYAKDETETMEMPYMKCIATQEMVFIKYQNAVISNSFEEIMQAFADDIKAEALILETDNRAMQAYNLPAFKASDLIPDKDENLVGKVIAIDTKYLLDGYKSMPHQLFYVIGGNGAKANHYSRACFCNHLYTGEEVRIERYEVLGIVPEDKLPDFAKKTLEGLKLGKEQQEQPQKTKNKKDREER